eukprot:1161852-Pelagomonas_calceolata.AAC.6
MDEGAPVHCRGLLRCSHVQPTVSAGKSLFLKILPLKQRKRSRLAMTPMEQLYLVPGERTKKDNASQRSLCASRKGFRICKLSGAPQNHASPGRGMVELRPLQLLNLPTSIPGTRERHDGCPGCCGFRGRGPRGRRPLLGVW